MISQDWILSMRLDSDVASFGFGSAGRDEGDAECDIQGGRVTSLVLVYGLQSGGDGDCDIV